MGKRNRWLGIGIAVIIIVSFQVYLGRNYLIIGPGPVERLENMITVETGDKNAKGAFLLTAVTSSPANIPSWIKASISPAFDISRRAQEIPEGMDLDRYITIMESLMRESQVIASAVALKKLGHIIKVETVVRVEAVLSDSVAKGILEQGDIILAVDDKKVSTANESVKIIGQRQPGENTLLTISRQGEVKRFKVGTNPHPEDITRAAVGILVSSSLTYDFPLNVQIDSGNVKGSSGGLMFALEIINQLEEGDLTKGHLIAGTGTIGLDGSVGPIAGVKQKIVAAERNGAKYFLVPAENFDLAKEIAQNFRSLEVIKVSHLNDALARLDDISRRNNNMIGE